MEVLISFNTTNQRCELYKKKLFQVIHKSIELEEKT